jgi:hypothetical protein
MEILTECPLRGTHFSHAVLIPKEITMYNMIAINMMKLILQEHKKVKTIQRILLITKLIVRIYFTKGMMFLTILWITKLMVRISTMKEMRLSLLHNVYQFLNKEVMRVYTNSKLCYWTLFINTRQA